ncbi:L-glyceraldehyde 3-phosphate reductase [Mycetocola manganoxydans]|uniref:L-glyceraldehyde 3-phosphate reductase n=1 Tax=Mycetocola manganoxydans TaxID=699879 RepID=A0A3L6ZTV1_9MICO|nr:L-glyceraldehyde 3-phosphate reductase [Mycetocola manganoxydans]RLP71317.1 L-glyceraldehyde 3-phosphate reductase [Mycetocola manganoxydans]GHD45765.1 glyceraldehyde 3-phosphate reductase [Mycetocola manganoxydans]
MPDDVRFDASVPDIHAPYQAASDRYTHLGYRRVGASGLLLPPISLGLWYNFGDNRPFDTQREILRHAFDRGITHFDLANNYGPPNGSAEENFGRMLSRDFRPYRSELIVSTKAGWPHWPGPYGNFGSRKYLLNSLDESLERLRTDYVDIFYSHRVDPDTPLEETIGALDTAVRQGKALYAGISSYSAERTERAIEIAKNLGTPLVIHQPSYSLVNRWVEEGLLDTLRTGGMGSIAFTPLAQGLLTGKFLADPHAEHATPRGSFNDSFLSEDNLARLRGLNDIAESRGQTLAQMAIAWVLRPGGATSALIGVSRIEQLDENLAALDNTSFSDDELTRIDEFAGDAGVNIWAQSSDL